MVIGIDCFVIPCARRPASNDNHYMGSARPRHGGATHDSIPQQGYVWIGVGAIAGMWASGRKRKYSRLARAGESAERDEIWCPSADDPQPTNHMPTMEMGYGIYVKPTTKFGGDAPYFKSPAVGIDYEKDRKPGPFQTDDGKKGQDFGDCIVQ